MTTEEKFNAAVNVIRSLPKNGAYQPSGEMMLKFYAYFKQATEGPCTQSKPAFWEVIKKMKWEAWNRLGNMPKHEAMTNYVAELNRIVETMSYNDNIGDYLGSLGTIYDTVPVQDLELLLGPVIERVRSRPGSPLQGSPLGSRETSPTRVPNSLINTRTNLSSLETSPGSSMSPSPQPPDTEDDDDEEFIDTVETTPHSSRKTYKSVSSSPMSTNKTLDDSVGSKMNGEAVRSNGYVASQTHNTSNNGHVNGYNGNHIDESEEDLLEVNVNQRGRSREKESPSVTRRRVSKQNTSVRTNLADVPEAVRETVAALQRDLDRVTQRVRELENSHRINPRAQSSYWPFNDISPSTAVFLVTWPFIVHVLIKYIQQHQRRQN